MFTEAQAQYSPSRRHVRRRAILSSVTLGIVGSLLLSACGGNQAAPFDRVFIDMMVPHHQGAVEMAKLAQQRGEHPEIKQLADAIIRGQNEEITKMKDWRKAWYGSDQTPPMNKMPMVPGVPAATTPGAAGSTSRMDHGAGGTMDMMADVDKLRGAQAPFDRAFIDMMIPHHQSAIDAARAAETRAEKQEIKELAKAIGADQQREIDQMRAWRRSWYG